MPIGKNDEERRAVVEAANQLKAAIRAIPRDEFYSFEPIEVKIDTDFEKSPGFRFNEIELRGVPVRVEIGPKDLAQGACVIGRRDIPGKEGKQMGVPLGEAPARVDALLREIQVALFNRAKAYRDASLHTCDSYAEFQERIEKEGGFFLCHWDGTRETEDQISAETKATIRCIPYDRPAEPGVCMVTGKPSAGRVVLARAY